MTATDRKWRKQVVEEAGKRKLQFFSESGSLDGPQLEARAILLRVQVNGDRVVYSYSLDKGRSFHQLGDEVTITFSFWKGSRPALFAYREIAREKADSGTAVESRQESWVDFDWAHYRHLSTPELSTGRLRRNRRTLTCLR